MTNLMNMDTFFLYIISQTHDTLTSYCARIAFFFWTEEVTEFVTEINQMEGSNVSNITFCGQQTKARCD